MAPRGIENAPLPLLAENCISSLSGRPGYPARAVLVVPSRNISRGPVCHCAGRYEEQRPRYYLPRIGTISQAFERIPMVPSRDVVPRPHPNARGLGGQPIARGSLSWGRDIRR